MVHAFTLLAAEAAEPSKTLFYVVGGALAVWAVVLSAVGLSRPEFPTSEGAQRGVATVSILLVVGAMAAVIVTA